MDDVLASWAVPFDPRPDAGLAVHVEDHPMEYELFEGVIPAGEYGGDVIVWDRGTWRPHETEDPAEAVRTGELHRTCSASGYAAGSPWCTGPRASLDKEQWLLLHKHDADAVSGWDAEDTPRPSSVGAPTTRSRRHRTGSGVRTCPPPRPPCRPVVSSSQARPRTHAGRLAEPAAKGRGRPRPDAEGRTSTRSCFPPEPARNR